MTNTMMMSTNRSMMRPVLSRQDLEMRVPAIFAEHAGPRTSARYTFVPTMEVINIMGTEGWEPVQAQYQKVRRVDRNGFQKHLVRFQNKALVLGDEAIDCIMVNSHDASSSYQFFLGIFRMVCSNGMITGSTFQEARIRHFGCTPEEIVGASRAITAQAPKLAGVMQDWKAIELTPDQRGAYAMAAAELIGTEENPNPLVYAEGALQVNQTGMLLEPIRRDDHGNDLWKTYNVVQERLLKGRFRKFNDRGQYKKSRAVKSIDRDIALNRALFTLTERMEELIKRAA